MDMNMVRERRILAVYKQQQQQQNIHYIIDETINFDITITYHSLYTLSDLTCQHGVE